MGRGGYTGGSSTFNIYRGGFSSHDPAETDSGVETHRPVDEKGKRTGAPQRGDIGEALNGYIVRIVISYQRGHKVPMCPKDLQRGFGALIRLSGGPLAWARSRPEYRTLYEKYRKGSLAKATVAYETQFRGAWAAGTDLPKLPPVIGDTYGQEIFDKGGVLPWSLLQFGLVGVTSASHRSFPPLPSPLTELALERFLIEAGVKDGELDLSDDDLRDLTAHLLGCGIKITWDLTHTSAVLLSEKGPKKLLHRIPRHVQ